MKEKWIVVSVYITLIIHMIILTVACALTHPVSEAPKPCEMKVYQYMDEYRVGTSCGHIVIDRCPFCDKDVEIVVE